MERHGRLYRKWVRSMLLVVAAILAVALVLCLYFINVIRSNVLQTSGDMSEYLRQNMDSRLQELQLNSAFFELNSINSRLKSLEEAPETTQEIYQFSDQLRNYRSSAALVDNIYIYYSQIEYILGNHGFYQADSYHTLMGLNERDYGELRPELRSEDTYFVSYEYGDGYCLFYVRPMYYQKQAVGAIVIEINQEELLRAGSVNSGGERLSLYGIAVDGALIANSTDEALVSGFEGLLRQIEPYGATSMEYEGVLSYVRGSSFPGVQYIAAYELSSLYSGIYTAGFVSGFGLLACLVLGVLSSLRISRSHAQPVEKLLQQMGPPAGDGTEPVDEYQYITQRVDQLLHDRYKSEEKLKEQQKTIDTLFISVVLGGQMQDEYAVFTAAQRYDVLFENSVYQTAVIQLSRPATDEMSEWVFAWLEAECEDFMVARMDNNQLVVLFNPEAPYGRDIASLLLGNLLGAVFEGVPAACGVGRGHDSMADIYTSYSEALSALPDMPDKGHVVGYYAPVARKNANTSGVAATEHFTHHLWAGRYQSAADMLDAVREEYLAPVFGQDVLEMRMAGLKSSMVNELEKLRATQQDSSYTAMAERVRKASTPEELVRVFEKILLAVTNAQKENAGREIPVPERAKQIIDKKLCDPMLGLYLISEQLQVSNTYLSTSFKARYGVGVVQYINQQRIEQAKKLILTTDISIKEIAETVGFTSDISFIRVFKRYESTTPASLRKEGAAG